MNEYSGLYVFAGVGVAMMIQSSYIRYLEKQKETKRTDEILSGVTEKPVYNENMERRYSIGGSKTKRKKQK